MNTRIESPLPLPPRPATGHKGLFGRVLIVGGHDEMIGAPVLAGTAALRTGSGLVQIAVPKSILPAALSITPELIGLALSKSSTRSLLDAASKADALVIGPGLGQSPDARSRVARLLRLDKPMVLDADALNLLAKHKTWPTWIHARAVLTPHPGEMNRLAHFLSIPKTPTGEDGRIRIALESAAVFRQVIVLKGHRTVVADRDRRVYVNPTGNSALSKAGSGDVLSGILGSLLGLKMEPFDAACIAVHLHGQAGEIASKSLGLRSPLASDILNAIPAAICDYEKRFPLT